MTLLAGPSSFDIVAVIVCKMILIYIIYRNILRQRLGSCSSRQASMVMMLLTRRTIEDGGLRPATVAVALVVAVVDVEPSCRFQSRDAKTASINMHRYNDANQMRLYI